MVVNIQVAVLATMSAMALLSAPANAAFVAFGNEVDWLNAVGAATLTEDFTGFPVDINLSESGILLSGGMTIRMLDPISSENFLDAANDFIHSRVSGPRQLGARIRVDFASPISAWSANLTSLGPTTGVGIYDLNDNLLGETVLGGPSFRGFQLSGGDVASYLEISRFEALDDLIEINSMSIVPEPSTGFLLALGLVGLAVRRQLHK